MADNTLNFDLDAPAVPTLTLDPTPAAVPQEEKPAAAPAPEAQVNLTPEEQAMVDQFAQKIDITNSQQVLQYGSACQKKIGDFSEAALSKVSTKDLGEVGDMITDLIGELKSFDANEEQQKGIMGFFRKRPASWMPSRPSTTRPRPTWKRSSPCWKPIRCSCSRISPCWTKCTS